MQVTTEDLEKVSFFDTYNKEQLITLINMCSIKEFGIKQVLLEQYEELKSVYVLLEGTLALGISISENRRIHLGTIEPGELFSWSAVFKPFISTAWVMTLTPAKVMSIDAKRLLEEIEKDCDFGLKTMTKLAMTLSRRLSDTRFQLMNHLIL